VSLVRTGLAAVADKPGTYKLGPAALTLGMAAILQIDSFEIMRREVTILRDETRQSTAVTKWTDDGVLSLFTQDGDQRGAFEMRAGLVPMVSTAAGRVFLASLPLSVTQSFIERELRELGTQDVSAAKFKDEMSRELARKKYSTFRRADLSGYSSISAPIFDFNGQVRFALSLVGTRNALQTERSSMHVKALLESAARATLACGGPVR
jgi:DNA-binding IclR family transcriptional regulator